MKKKNDDAILIHNMGGPAEVARKLGYKKGGTQRVFNWITRGIPAEIKLNHQDIFLGESVRRSTGTNE